MKILVLQLARFGDIYQTWPALKSLRRSYPEATIDLLVRDRFEAATRGLDAISTARVFPVKQILKPIWDSDDGLDDRRQWVKEANQECLDNVENSLNDVQDCDQRTKHRIDAGEYSIYGSQNRI